MPRLTRPIRSPLLACAAALLMALALLLPALPGQAVSGETRVGYFEYSATIYDRSSGYNVGIGSIPPNTPLTLTQVNMEGHMGYGIVTHEGITGFARTYMLQPLPEDRPDERAGKEMFAPDVRMLRAYSLHGSEILKRLPPETLVTVVARGKGMLKVTVEGLTGYIYGNNLAELGLDSPLEPALLYSVREQALLAHPLQGGAVLKNLRQGELVVITAQNRGYYRVTSGDMAGYLKMDGLARIGQMQDDVMLVYGEEEVPLYGEPGLSLGASDHMAPGRLYQVAGQAGDFLQLMDSGLFVEAARVQALVLKAFKAPRLGFVEAPQALFSRPEGQEEGQLTPLHLYRFTAQAGSWWYINDGQVQGFVPARAISPLPEKGEAMNRTYAVYTGSQALLSGSSSPQAVAEGGQILLAQMYGSQWFKTDAGAFVHRSQLDIIASDAPVTPHIVKATPGLSLLSLPDSRLGQVLLEIPEGEMMQVTGFSRSFLLVKVKGLEGYVPGKTLKTFETRYLSDTEDTPPLLILVNKADLSVSLYALDEEGQRTGAPLSVETAALGKRTTPTPSGRFVLGFKQRWVHFSSTSAPHSITYVRGRYIHGIPCYGTSESEAASWGLQEIGSFATGGCVRLPFDMAAYLYFNCPSYTTVMEVINGQ